MVTIALAYNLYLHLDPRNNGTQLRSKFFFVLLSHTFVFLFLPFRHSVTLDELGTEASQAYPNDHSINIDLQQVHDLSPY